MRTIAFHEKHVAEWLDHIHGTLPHVDVLLPTIEPTMDDKSDVEGGDPPYSEKPRSFTLSVVPKVEFDMADYHPAETFWSTLT